MNYLYNILPRWLQDIAVSVYGFKIMSQRFGPDYISAKNEIDFSLDLFGSEGMIKDHLLYAARNVPYYKDRVSISCILSSTNVSEAILAFPIIKKKDVLENREDFVSSISVEKKIVLNTSGSTGTPLSIYVDRRSLGHNYAFFHEFLRSNGLSEFDRSATFAGRLVVPVNKVNGPFHRVNWPMKTMLMSSYHISPQNVESYLSALKKWKPKFIDAYPSAIYELAYILKDKSVEPGLNLQGIVTSSETLKDYQRDLIEDVFSCQVFDYYGCAEQVALAVQSDRLENKYLVPSQYGLVEILDNNNFPVKPNESGKMVCTNLFNKVMPLIRYEIGDDAILSENYKGSRFAKYLSSIVGRSDDVIINEGGNRVGRLDPVFKGTSGIKEAQIVQQTLNFVELRIVRDKRSVIDEDKLIKALKDRLGESMGIKIIYCDTIPRNSSGKFRSVISNVNQ